jgi:hypothetical protein
MILKRVGSSVELAMPYLGAVARTDLPWIELNGNRAPSGHGHWDATGSSPFVFEQNPGPLHLKLALFKESRGPGSGSDQCLLKMVEMSVRCGLRSDTVHSCPPLKGSRNRALFPGYVVER